MIELFARSPGMREAVGLAERVSSTDANVWITGESGAGKDVLASFIHWKSPRATQPLVKIDCATLPGDLLEAELFGYERGAFTGASEAKPGRFEAAQKGTLVLDEIAHLSIGAQAKLLRVIETHEFERLGGRKTIKIDSRLIALTNVDLGDAVKAGRFREDLFYRLDVIHIRVPPLRERKEDLSKLLQYFLKHYSAKHGRKVERVSAPALALLQAYDYPGNARELANIVERAVIVANGKGLEEHDLPAGLSAAVSARRQQEKPPSLAELEAAYIAEVLARTKGNKTECARILGISRKNLYEKIARYDLSHR
ncbi:MAG TPA: sigma-54 dependent transcriptional regulator [Pyrinomonadaceae bacterium]|nr:sigma-54 dependent transcriptional regulator [Pyrinomonadaceae bacterium]